MLINVFFRAPWSAGKTLKSEGKPTVVHWLVCSLLNKVRGFKSSYSLLWWRKRARCLYLHCDWWCVCSEGAAAVWRKRLQSAGDSSVHLGPQVSRHSSAGNHPREEHGDSAPTPDQQVLPLITHALSVDSLFSRLWFWAHQWEGGRSLFICLFRILGTRVAELEKKLKTLEMSGLWSLPGKNKGIDWIRCFSLKPVFYILFTITWHLYAFLLLSFSFLLPGGLTYNVSLGIYGSMFLT